MTGYAEEDDEEGLLYNEENTSSREAAREMSRLKTTGAFDSFLGVDQFWREKVLLVILALQDFALLWMGPMEWPWHFWRVSHPSLWMILDTRTERDYTLPSCENCTDPAFAGLCYEARTGCVPFLREPPRAGYGLFLFIAAGAVVLWTLLPRFSQAGILSPAFTYNIERMLFPLYMIAYTPVAIVFMYAFCDYDVFVVEQWECRPDGQSLIWAGFSSLYLLGLPLLLVHRVRCQTVFRSPLRHETYLRTRELEYRLKLSTFYRDRRLWLQSSFTRAGRHAHAWMLLHKLAMVWLIILVAWGMDANLASGIMTLSYWVPNLALLIGWQTHRVATSHWTLILCQSMVSANAGTGFGTLLGARLVSEKDLGIGMQYFNAGWCVLLVCFFIVILLLAYDFQPRNSAEKRNFRVMRSMRGTLDTGCRLSKDKRKHLHLGRSLNLLIIEKCRERLAQRASIANRLEQKKSSLRGEDRVEGVVKRAILTFTVTSFDELDFVRDLAIFSALRLKERNITIISVCASKPGAADAATKQKKKEPAKTRRNLPENMENSAWQDSALMISRKSIAAAGEKGASLSFAAGRSSVAVKLQLEATDLPVADIARVVAERCNAPGDLLREALSVVACEVQDVPVLCELSVAIDTIIRRYSSIFMEARTMSEVVPVLISPAVRNIPERDFDDWVSREVTSIAVKHHDPDAQTADVIIHVSAESLAAGTLLEKIAVFSNSSNELVLYFRPEIFDAYVTPLFELQLAEKEHDDEVNPRPLPFYSKRI
ncbi:hypothetical protein DIPPA_11442 [Diplonema papillatum]|nr:hypothetical protein DIPPA_11442 [Diplonema papillatum]